MNQHDRQLKQKQEQDQKELMQFLEDSFHKLFRFQLDNDIVVIPMIIKEENPFKGHHLTPELTFRKMSPEDKKTMEEQLAKSHGLVLPS